MSRRLLPVLALALLATGCASDPPQVTFAAGAVTVEANPAQYCDIDLTDCTADDKAPVDLAVPPDTPLTVTVPEDVSAAPWQVVFTYRDAAGTQVDGRSPVFAPAARPSYDLRLPAATDRLLGAQVQQYGPPPQANAETGELEFPIRASWVLRATQS